MNYLKVQIKGIIGSMWTEILQLQSIIREHSVIVHSEAVSVSLFWLMGKIKQLYLDKGK